MLKFDFKKRLFFPVSIFIPARLLFIFLFILNSHQVMAETWIHEDANTITINSANYDAYCDKTTGLCDFYNKLGEKLFGHAGDIYIGVWEGQCNFGPSQELYDENYIRKRDYTVSSSSLSESADGNTAVITFTQTKPNEVQFDTAYTFSKNDSKVLVDGQITYLTEKKVTNEVIKTEVPDAFTVTTVEPFEPANLINVVQIDNMDDITGWNSCGTGQVIFEKNTDLNYIKEGSGSIKVVFMDNGNSDHNESTGITKSFNPTGYPNKTHLSFWVYPLHKIWLYVTIYSTSGSPETRTILFPANEWSLFQWDFKRSYNINNLQGFYKIQIRACEKYLDEPNITVYIDDISFSDNIENGLMSSIGPGDGLDLWSGIGGQTIDTSLSCSGNGSLKWTDVTLVAKDALLYQHTTEKDNSKANPDLPTDISAYDYLVFDAYTTRRVAVGFSLLDKYGKLKNTPRKYIPANRWQTIKLDFKNDFWGDDIDHTHIKTYYFVVQQSPSVSNCTVWLDNLRLVKLKDGCEVFDGYGADYDKQGKAVKYSSRVFKINNQTFIYGDNFGASNIEYMNKNPGEKTIDCYIYKVDMHTLRTSVDRNNNEGASFYYKEVTRKAADVSEGTVVYDFKTSPPVEIIKSRWPRNFGAAYSISDDDFYFKASKAFYCGTSDSCSPDYGSKGIIGHNLRTTKNLWYYMTRTDGGGIYKDYPDIKEFFDLMYNNGIEIAIHTPGGGADNRTRAIEALSDLTANYKTRSWADHSSADNPEDFYRRGAFTIVNGIPNDTNDGYYMLDLVKEKNLTYIWQVTNPMTSAGTSNLFYDKYKDICPLPYKNQIIDGNQTNPPIYLYGRSAGNGYDEFLYTEECGGNITELQKIIETNGLVLVYTHSSIGFYDNINNIYVLKDGAENVFAWLETKQNEGALWIETTSNILDWMIDLENVTITNQTSDTATVLNDNDKALSGITLKLLNNSINCVKTGDIYQIYVDGNSVVLPRFSAGESKAVKIVTGTYDSSLPKLTSLPPHISADNAQYDANSGIVSLTLDYQETPGSPTKSITPTINNYNHPFPNAISTITSTGDVTLCVTLPAAPTTFNAVNMEITPSSNSVAVTIDDWNTPDFKQWTETVDGPLTVGHTIGDLKANTYYIVRVNRTVCGTYFSGRWGQISYNFSYDAAGIYTNLLTTSQNLHIDIDDSGSVNFIDFALLARNWLKEGPNLKGDLDLNGIVDFKDVATMTDYWLTTGM